MASDTDTTTSTDKGTTDGGGATTNGKDPEMPVDPK